MVSSAGGIEEDLIKCMAPTYMGDFSLPGKELRSKGLNRIGNLLVPNSNYCLFENWVTPILDSMVEEQKEVRRVSYSMFVKICGMCGQGRERMVANMKVLNLVQGLSTCHL